MSQMFRLSRSSYFALFEEVTKGSTVPCPSIFRTSLWTRINPLLLLHHSFKIIVEFKALSCKGQIRHILQVWFMAMVGFNILSQGDLDERILRNQHRDRWILKQWVQIGAWRCKEPHPPFVNASWWDDESTKGLTLWRVNERRLQGKHIAILKLCSRKWTGSRRALRSLSGSAWPPPITKWLPKQSHPAPRRPHHPHGCAVVRSLNRGET